MKNNPNIIKDFMAVFPNAASKEYCNTVIKWFEHNNKAGAGGQKNTISRQDNESGTLKIEKDSEQFFFENVENMYVPRTLFLMEEFANIVWKSYKKFMDVYGAGMNCMGTHKISPSVKIQRYEPTQGYHTWHADVTHTLNSRRILVCLLYLNTVKKGGETEFLYQKQRVPAVQGSLVMFPATWTHLHRGNPPLIGNKYVINTWLEFMD